MDSCSRQPKAIIGCLLPCVNGTWLPAGVEGGGVAGGGWRAGSHSDLSYSSGDMITEVWERWFIFSLWGSLSLERPRFPAGALYQREAHGLEKLRGPQGLSDLRSLLQIRKASQRNVTTWLSEFRYEVLYFVPKIELYKHRTRNSQFGSSWQLKVLGGQLIRSLCVSTLKYGSEKRTCYV